MARLKVIAWNVYEGHDPATVEGEVVAMTGLHWPHIVALFEAKNLHGRLRVPGYRVIQLRPVRNPGRMTETANVALLVRDGVRIKRRGALRMKRTWRGPVHGHLHDPRVYRFVVVKPRRLGPAWKVGGFHLPFGTAPRAESFRRMRRWFRRSSDRRPVVAVGDMNGNAALMRARVGDRVGARVAGHGVDLAIFLRCRLARVRNLGRHGSDHPALLYVFATGGRMGRRK